MKIKVSKCNLLYEDWQMQCCGEPLKKGSSVTLFADYHNPRKLGGWMRVDFDENHHDSILYSLNGKVSDIKAIFVDVTAPSGYIDDKDNKFTPIQIDHFDGWEKPEVYEQFSKHPDYYLVEMEDVEISYRYPQENGFRITINDLSSGWESVALIFNGIKIPFEASYIGCEPLSTLIEAVDALDEEYISGSSESHYSIIWNDEPGLIELSYNHSLNTGQLTIRIRESEDDDFNDSATRQWNIEMNYEMFRDAVINVTVEVLSKYGIQGFNQNWQDGADTLPLGSLLNILGAKTEFDQELKAYKSDFIKEISLLSKLLSKQEKS